MQILQVALIGLIILALGNACLFLVKSVDKIHQSKDFWLSSLATLLWTGTSILLIFGYFHFSNLFI